MTQPQQAWCPSLDHRPALLVADREPGISRCPVCGTRHANSLIRSRPELYREPVAGHHPGYDPASGAEVQDLPR